MQINKKEFSFASLPEAVNEPISKKKHGISGKTVKSKVIQIKSDPDPDKNKPDIANTILSGIKQLEMERASNNAFCKQLINSALRKRDTLTRIRQITRAHCRICQSCTPERP